MLATLNGESTRSLSINLPLQMAAALNAVSSKGPVLLATPKRAGHSGSGQRQDFLEQQTNAWTFLFDQLGMNAQLAVEEKGSVI